jgi:glutathionylspermidine synthase
MPWGASDVQGNGEALRQAAPCDGREGNYAVLGSWIVQGKPCGLSVREDLETDHQERLALPAARHHRVAAA